MAKPHHSQAPHLPERKRQDVRIASCTSSPALVVRLIRSMPRIEESPAAKILVFPMTVPLDLALLPFEVIGGLF